MSERPLEQQLNESTPIIVKVKPGTSSEKAIMFELAPAMAQYSIDQLVQHALSQASRKNERVADRLKTEMAKKYGITANGKVAQVADGAATYVSGVKELEDGVKYREIKIIIASQQEGGLYR